MRKNITLAEPVDMSTGFKDFFDTIGMTGGGLVTKGIAAVISIIAIRMMFTAHANPKSALQKGSMAVGTLFVAVVLALYGDTLFSTVTEARN